MSENKSTVHAAVNQVSDLDAVNCHAEVMNIDSVDTSQSGNGSGDTNSVQVNLQTSGLAFQVHTQMPVNNQIIDLTARVELLTAQLEQAQSCLQQSMHRIGFLEAQLEQQKQLINHLCKKEQTP